MKILVQRETTLKAWAINRWFGLAQIIDGLVYTVSIGYVSTQLGYNAAMALARERYNSKKD